MSVEFTMGAAIEMLGDDEVTRITTAAIEDAKKGMPMPQFKGKCILAGMRHFVWAWAYDDYMLEQYKESKRVRREARGKKSPR